MSEVRRSRSGRSLAVTLILFIVLTLIVVWGIGGRGTATSELPSPPRPEPTSPREESGSVPTGSAVPQPGPGTYQQLVTVERYRVLGEDGKTELQQRHRESWRAADGWAWARQTGDDAGHFIFKPDTDWKLVRGARPQAAALDRAMRKAMRGVPSSDIADAEFTFAVDLLGVETLPSGSLPKNYRRALLDALACNDEITVTEHTPDPLGRESTRVTFRDADDQSNIITRSLYLDREYRYLANDFHAGGSGEEGSRIVKERRQVKQIPGDLLDALGDKRIEKAVWG